MRHFASSCLLITFAITMAGCRVDDGGQAFVDDVGFRRRALTAALWRPELPYAQKLLKSYALGDRGWDLLPQFDLRRLPKSPPAVSPVPMRSDDEWLALGRYVFFYVPMRSDAYVAWAVDAAQAPRDYGIERAPDGSAAGFVRYRDRLARPRVGMTCAGCHAANGKAGRGSRTLDLGAARADYAEQIDVAPAAGISSWGPGRLDVTEDGAHNPSAIPDLFALEYATYLNHSGVIEMHGVETLAVRFDTQYILGHELAERLPRDYPLALARYVMSLSRDVEHKKARASDVLRGEALFNKRCVRCHKPERAYAGDLAAVGGVNSDAAVASSPSRGTGFYKVPALQGVRDAGPYLHDGSQPTLTALLTAGHPRRNGLTENQVRDLVAFLNTL